MNVFISLGTTPFPEFINAVKACQLDAHFDLVVQHIEEQREFKKSFVFDAEIDKWYEWADVVVCHAGAGTVFNVLEKGIKALVVPNLSRKDPHQEELVNYLSTNSLTGICRDFSDLRNDILFVFESTYCRYEPDEFSGAKEIVELLL